MEKIFGILSGGLLVASQVAYAKSVLQRKIYPNILSWFGWSFLIGSAWFSQTLEGGFVWSSLGVLLSSAGCCFIAFSGLINKNYIIEKRDWFFLILGISCFVIYMFSKNQWTTTIFAISADFALAIPMLHKAIRVKNSEDSTAWYFSLASWFIAVILSFNDDLIYRLFPIYLFIFSAFMVMLMHRKPKS